MNDLPPPKPIREYARIGRRQFDEEIRPLAQPAILRGLGADWPAVHAALRSPEAAVDYLFTFNPVRPIAALLGAPEIEGRFFYAPDYQSFNFTRGKVTLEAFFERLLRDRSLDRPFSLAMQSEIIPTLLPGFEEANRLDLVDASVQPRMWTGNRIRVAPHYDLHENVGVVVSGRRRFTLYPPDQIANMYMGPLEVTPAGTPVSLVDPAAPDLERFPRFAEAAALAQSAVLEPGDAIYIPFHWWHAVDSLDDLNIFVNYWWNDARAGLGKPYDALIMGLLAFRHLPHDQREIWRRMFDHLVFEADGDPVAHLPDEAKGVLGPADDERLAFMRAAVKQLAAGL